MKRTNCPRCKGKLVSQLGTKNDSSDNHLFCVYCGYETYPDVEILEKVDIVTEKEFFKASNKHTTHDDSPRRNNYPDGKEGTLEHRRDYSSYYYSKGLRDKRMRQRKKIRQRNLNRNIRKGKI